MNSTPASVGAHRLAAELVHLPLEKLCDQLLEQLVDGHPADGVALVAVRLHRPQPAGGGLDHLPGSIAVPEWEH